MMFEPEFRCLCIDISVSNIPTKLNKVLTQTQRLSTIPIHTYKIMQTGSEAEVDMCLYCIQQRLKIDQHLSHSIVTS